MNRLFLLFFGMVTFVAHAQVPDYAPTEGLVGWWPLDGNADDESGYGNEGIVYGSIPTTDHLGTNNSALLFDGTDDYIEISNTNGLSSSQGLSMAIWFYWEGANGNNNHQYLFLIANNPNGAVTISDDGLCRINVLNCNCANDINLTTQILANTWYQVALTYSLNDGLMKMYLNGELVESSVESMYNYYSTNNPADRFGNYHFNSHYFKGKLNDAGLWNRALTEEEITALYNAAPAVPGCTDPIACNYDAEATSDDGSCLPSGCMEPLACNYNALAECEGEACDYTCCPGPGCCLDGTVWDSELGGCTPLGTSCLGDLDFDGVVGVNDLMTLLSTFGTDCPDAEEPETTEWTCGDPVSYHGYDYATIQIGEQCWFAENLATALYLNEDSIPTGHSASEWSELSIGAYCNPSDGIEASSGYGLLYNWFAVTDPRAICPFNWHVPTDEEWSELTTTVGGADIAGEALKANAMLPIGWDGTDEFGFSAIPSGLRIWDTGQISFVGQNGYWWTVTEEQSKARDRQMYSGQQSIYSYVNDYRYGFSVRCLKD